MKQRNLQPLVPEHWPTALRDIRNSLGNPLNIHNIMAHHPDLMKAWMPFRNHVVANSSLLPRQRELLILRTAHLCRADYEWSHHIDRGLAAGLSRQEIERVKQGPEAADWQADETTLLSAADDCHRHNCISDSTRRQLDEHFDTQQQLDILVTVGMYITLALIIRTYAVPLEQG